MMRLQINRLERRLLNAEKRFFLREYPEDRDVRLSLAELRDLLDYVARLERTIRGLRLDDKVIRGIADRVQDSVRDSVSGISYDASRVLSSALQNLPAQGIEVIA